MDTDVHVGSTLGGYRISRMVGRGGMGVVYLANDLRLDRVVALKILAPDVAVDAATRERFIHESRLAAAIEHPNIVPIFGAGEDEGRLWISMRYIDGLDLRSMVARRGPLDAPLAARLLRQIAAALDAAHARGIVHRDVKPSNILVGRDPQAGGHLDRIDALGEHAYLTDFGLTRRIDDLSTATTNDAFAGTIDYVAPEQIEGGPIDGRTDQYGLAGTLYTALAGTPPFERDVDLATIHAHLRQPAPSITAARPDLPPAVDGVLAKGLAKDPAARYPSATALIDAFEAAMVPPAPPAGLHGEGPGRRRSLATVWSTILIIAAVAIAAVFIVRSVVNAGSAAASQGVFEVRLPSGALVSLAPGLERPNSLAVSHNGRWFAVAAAGDPTREIYVSALGTENAAVSLPAGYDVDHAPDWSVGGTLAISRAVRGTLHIFVVDPNGSSPVQLTFQVGSNDRSPVWSPDGTMIAFVRSTKGESHILVMHADGTKQVDLSPPGADDGTPRWSPDGRSLAIVRTEARMRQIFVVSVAGSDERAVTDGQYDDGAPAWSPEGDRLAFVRHYSGNSDVMVVPVGGGTINRLTTSPNNDEQPVWSPDGSLIAFVQRHQGRSHICVIAPDGSAYRQLTAGPFDDDEPAWLPGGALAIVFIRSPMK